MPCSESLAEKMAVVPSVMRFAGDDPVNGLTSIRLVVLVSELQLQSSVPSTMSDEVKIAREPTVATFDGRVGNSVSRACVPATVPSDTP